MTLLLSHITQSSVGERCASYITTITDTLHSLLLSAKTSFPSLALPSDWAISSTDPVPVVLTVVALALALVVMSWRFGDLWRRSPYSKASPPHISESDYTYLTPEDIVDPPAQPYSERYAAAEDDEPDTLLLKHRKNTYALHFPAYAINDGALRVGELRQRAAEVTRTSDPARIKLLYKGKLLDDDSVSCRLEGLKQQSEVLCVVSEVQPGESTPSEGSEAEVDRAVDDAGGLDLDEAPSGGDKRIRNRIRNKNKKKKGKNRKLAGGDPESLAPPADQQGPPPSTKAPSLSSSSFPPPAPNIKNIRTPLDQANTLLSYFQTELLPLCDAYIAHPPTEAKARDFEHKKLSETILAQVILKADGIEPDGDEAARNARRALIKETQATLNRLDQAANER